MDLFFEHTLKNPTGYRSGAQIWLRKEPYTPRNKWLKKPFTRKEYETNPGKHLSFQRINNQFICGDPDCKNNTVICIWYEYNGIAPGVDETFGEFFCEQCGTYTFVDYYRDTS